MDPVMSPVGRENVSSVPSPLVTKAPVVPAFAVECGRPPMVAVGMWLGEARSMTQNLLSSAYRHARQTSSSALDQVRARAQRAKEEQTLSTLALISGCAFVAGLTLAVWRSQKS